MSEKQKWYWYAARADELMVDLDSQTLLEIALKRLAKPDIQFPPVKSVFLSKSFSEGHFHMTVLLKDDYTAVRRMVLQLYLMDHVYRSVKNFMRVLDGSLSPCLLITPYNWRSSGASLNGKTKFWREPDALCHCPIQRHKSHKAILTCPAHIRLRGGV